MIYKGLPSLKDLSIYFLVNILVLISKDTCAQTLNADFSVEPVVCLNQQLKLTNSSSSDADTFFWDFCLTDIQTTPMLNFLGRAGSITNLGAIEFVNDDGNWFGFIPGRGDNHLYRLDFGTALTDGFTLVDLGDFGGALNAPKNLRLIKVNGQWSGLLVNVSNSLVRLSFTGGLSQTPIVENLGNLGGMSAPIGLEIVRDGTDYVALISSYGGVLSVINFGNSILNTPSGSNIHSFGVSPVSGSVGISIVKDSDGVWRGIISSYNDGKIYKVHFDNGLFQPPGFTLLTVLSSPTETRLVLEGGAYYGFVVSQVGTLLRIKFGESIVNGGEIFENLGNFGSLANLDAFSLVKYNGTWNGFAADRVTGNVYNLSFFSECNFINIDQSEEVAPIGIKYNIPDNYYISLMAFDNLGNSVEVTKPTQVNGIVAPDFTISIENACVNNVVGFSKTNSSAFNIILFDWDFGDGQNSSQESPYHTYSNTGEYRVEFIGTADNGCKNSTSVIHKIYAPPTSAFTLPTGLICTNNEFTFTNNTADIFDGNLTYQWLVNDVQKSTTRDFKYAFTTGGDQQVKLITFIPGCSDELTQTISNVQIGPVVGFSFIGKCEAEEIVFTNASSGSISGYQWDFDNGSTSTEVNPVKIYAQGNYEVSLVTTGTNGCTSTTTKSVPIYSKPQPNFSIDLPPFSCSGSPSQFNDLTPPLTDSNITFRTWSFGDAGNGSSTQTNPAYTYSVAGDYQVTLGVTSNFGCSNTTQKVITVAPSPVVNFTNTPACLNQATQFTDASGLDAKTWLWSIQNSTYSTKNPVHTFNTTGTLTAKLTVTGYNNCVSQLSKQIEIPVPVVADFTAQSTCATKPSVFTALNAGGADPAVAWAWDFAGQSGSGSPAQHVFSKVGNYPVKLSVTRQSGCAYSTTKFTSIIQPPVADFTMNPESGGAPLAVSFTNTSSSATNYVWRFNDANDSISTEFSPSFVFDQLGTYPVELIASNSIGCSDSIKRDVQVVVPQINAMLSELRLTRNPDGTFKATVTLENEGNIAIINPEIYLDVSGLIQVKEMFSATILPNQSLTRTLTASILSVNLSYACAEVSITGDSKSFDNRECTSLESEVIVIQPYPNPATAVVYLDWINQDLESMQVIIYNSFGQAVLNQTYSELVPGLNQVQVDVSQLSPGIYIASYTTGSVSQSLRFSVVR